jgi:hypothetical protein
MEDRPLRTLEPPPPCKSCGDHRRVVRTVVLKQGTEVLVWWCLTCDLEVRPDP